MQHVACSSQTIAPERHTDITCLLQATYLQTEPQPDAADIADVQASLQSTLDSHKLGALCCHLTQNNVLRDAYLQVSRTLACMHDKHVFLCVFAACTALECPCSIAACQYAAIEFSNLVTVLLYNRVGHGKRLSDSTDMVPQ